MTYRDAGVDIDAGNELVERIKPLVKRSFRPEVMGGLGGFGALFDLSGKYREPVLVSGTDGVGTKLKLAFEWNMHDTVGIDLVAMSVNDVLVQGAEPLFFLDYFACGKLHVDTAAAVVGGIAKGCELSGCALIGGETAEMPGMYARGDYDVAGFVVGAAERGTLLPKGDIVPGDVIIGLASSGVHSNGFSLVRKIIADGDHDYGSEAGFAPGETLGRALLAPTRIYVRAGMALHRAGLVKAFSHITGGGLTENIPRVLPDGVVAELDGGSWPMLPVFRWLQRNGGVTPAEMARTFNCSLGLIAVVAAEHEQAALTALRNAGETAWTVGRISAAAKPNAEPETRLNDWDRQWQD